jgi:hypothetical protein
MNIYSAVLSLALVQSTAAEWPTYFPTAYQSDDGAASSNLGVVSDVTAWPTYSPTMGGGDSSSANTTASEVEDTNSTYAVSAASTEDNSGATARSAATIVFGVVASALCLN